MDQALVAFQIRPDHDLDLMRSEQRLDVLAAAILDRLAPVLAEEAPDVVLVQGDTITTVAAALAAFYNEVPVAHLEAGLRSNDIRAPWPEEANRRITSLIADLHFAPTAMARDNLLRDGVAPDRVHLTGNTVIDALRRVPHIQRLPWPEPEGRRLIVVTAHRRENLGDPYDRILTAVLEIARRHPCYDVYLVTHRNPQARAAISRLMGVRPPRNLHQLEPLDYITFINLLRRAHVILTDSGGIQEEAAAMGIPVLVLRDKTERPEVLIAGVGSLVGTRPAAILEKLTDLLGDDQAHRVMSERVSAFGDGNAAERVVKHILEFVAMGAGPRHWSTVQRARNPA